MAYILIVDDDPVSSEILKILLQDEDYRIEVANNGIVALEKIEAGSPELILMDINMPGLTGIETCKRIKSNPATQDIPIIFLTAQTEYEIKEQAFEAGGQDYITKPFHDGETVARVRNQLRIRRSIRQLEQYHKREQHYLKNLLQLQEDFIASVTHDIKNPLSVIAASIYIIRQLDPRDWSEVLDKVNVIDQASQKMKMLVSDVLDVIRFESQASHIQPVNLKSTILHAIENLESIAKNKDIQLKFEPTSKDMLVQADRQQILSIFDNVLSNAIKYSPPSTQVTIRTTYNESLGYMEVHIKDQGYGISEDELGKIFNRFYRITDDIHQKEKGSGLGLYIVKSLIERSGGSITVDSKIGKGSTFILRFVTSGTLAMANV